jgi:hypothetical protein
MAVPTDLGHLVGRDLTVELDDEMYPLRVIDWPDLLRESDALATRAAGLSPAEVSELYQRHRDPVGELHDYWLGEHADRVVDGDWLPFGLLGLDGGPDSYAEIDNSGILVFDLTRDGSGTPVLWIRDDEVTEVAADLAALPILDADDE